LLKPGAQCRNVPGKRQGTFGDLKADAQIDVEVNRGVVSLGGFVDSNAERDAAVAAAKRVKGVQKVINNLAVR